MKTFENFQVIPANRLAFLAAERTCQFPGTYNPLYIYGVCGTGKTHLLMAIADHFRKNGKTVELLSCQQLCEEMISAIKNSTMSEYRTKYHEADIVLIDNLQYLKGKENTQEELFTILEKRLSNGKQTILAGNLSPAEISFWDSQLASHITSGLCIQTQVPNSEERSQIVANKLKERGMDWPMEACRYVAHNAAFSWFQIDGEINKIVFLKELYNKQ